MNPFADVLSFLMRGGWPIYIFEPKFFRGAPVTEFPRSFANHFDDVRVGGMAKVRRAILERGTVVPPGAWIRYDCAADTGRFTMSANGLTIVGRSPLIVVWFGKSFLRGRDDSPREGSA